MISRLEFENNDNDKKYNVKAICNGVVYGRESKGHLLSLYYLVFWKGYLKEENFWESTSVI